MPFSFWLLEIMMVVLVVRSFTPAAKSRLHFDPATATVFIRQPRTASDLTMRWAGRESAGHGMVSPRYGPPSLLLHGMTNGLSRVKSQTYLHLPRLNPVFPVISQGISKWWLEKNDILIFFILTMCFAMFRKPAVGRANAVEILKFAGKSKW